MVQVLAAKADTLLTTDATEVQRLFIDGNNFVDGHRYLTILKYLSGRNDTGGRVRMLVGGAETVPVSDTFRSDNVGGASNAQIKQGGNLRVMIPNNGNDVEVLVSRYGPAGTARFLGAQLLMIDLDDGLIFDQDWRTASDNTGESFPAAFGGGTEEPAITFTPDGVSDYLVIGGLKSEDGGASESEEVRIQDTTNNTTIAFEAKGNGNILVEEHGYLLMGVMEAPSATARTIELQYRGAAGSVTKRRGNLFFLRLNAFRSYAFFQSDLNSVPVAGRQSIGSFQYTPDADGRVVLLSSFRANAPSGFESGEGIIGELEYDSSVVATLVDEGEVIAPSFQTAGGYVASVGPNFHVLLAGKSGEATVEGFVEPGPTPATTTLREMVIVAFGTLLGPATNISGVSPSTFSALGGTKITISGTFDPDSTYAVHIGPSGSSVDSVCYAGEGLGTRISPLNGSTLECFTPELEVGKLLNVTVINTTGGEVVVFPNSVRTVQRDYGSLIWQMKRLFAPNRRVGPRDFQQLLAVDRPKNLLVHTGDLSQPDWALDNITLSTGQEDPFGGMNGFSLDENGANSQHRISQDIPLVAGEPVALSVYAKRLNQNFVALRGTVGAEEFARTYNLLTGGLGATVLDNDLLIVDASIKAVDLVSDWFRIDMVGLPTESGTFSFFIEAHDTDDLGAYTGATQQSILVAFPNLDLYPFVRAYRESGAEPATS